MNWSLLIRLIITTASQKEDHSDERRQVYIGFEKCAPWNSFYWKVYTQLLATEEKKTDYRSYNFPPLVII